MALGTARKPKVRLMDKDALPIRPVDPVRKPDAWFRSDKHLASIRTMSCACGCGGLAANDNNPVEAAHVRTGTDGAAGTKPSDFYVLPLTLRCHKIQLSMSERAFWAQRGVMDPAFEALKLALHSPCERTRKAAAAVLDGKSWQEAF